METAEYWLMAQEYAIWNTAITSLQFWIEDLDLITLCIASECVYTTFFWSPTSHTLHQLSEDVLFGCFVIESGLLNNVCQHPCPYGSNDTVSYMDSLDLSDILDYEDYMVTCSDEELPGVEEVPY